MVETKTERQADQYYMDGSLVICAPTRGSSKVSDEAARFQTTYLKPTHIRGPSLHPKEDELVFNLILYYWLLPLKCFVLKTHGHSLQIEEYSPVT
jgi:hypothetical protein